MDLRPPRLYKWYKPIDEREKALDMPDLTEEQRAAMDLARPPAPSLPGAPEGEPGAAPAAAPDAEDEGEPVVFTAPEHVQIQTREEQLEEIRQMGLGDLCMDDPEPKIAMPDWAGGGSESLGVVYDEEREKLARELCEEPMESEAPDACAPAPAPGPAPAIDDDRVHEPTDPELIQLNGLLQSALTELGHKVIEFGWDKDPNHGKSPLCLPYDEYMKPITTSEEEAGYDPEVDDPDWDNYPFKWGGVVPEAWALEFIAKYLKEHNPNRSGAPAPAPSPAPAAAEAPAPAAPSEAPALPREVLPLLNEPDYVDTQKRVLGAMPSEIPSDTTGEIQDSDLVAPGLALLQQQ